MKMSNLLHKVRNRFKKLRLQPIRIFDMHHVTAAYDAESMNRGDWMQIDEFKQKLIAMRDNGVKFISMTEAYRHICTDWLRFKKYVVITFDDGYASLKEVLPWLDEQHIPATLFINGKYLDGKSYRKNPKERYLTYDELFALASSHTHAHTSGARQMVEVGSHGWEHTDATQMTLDEFDKYIDDNVELLRNHPCYIPFHAYTWNSHTTETDASLHSKNIIPIYIDGVKNYNDINVIHRELL